MILQKIKVSVETNTNVKFITSIPVTITVREALPLLLKAYLAVVHQNYDHEEAEQLVHANRIRRITKNGYLIPLAEEVIHVINDSDTLVINVAKQEKKEQVVHASKKEKLETKKEDKKLEKIKEKIVEDKKITLQAEKKQHKPTVEKEVKPVQARKDSAKKQEGKSTSQGKSSISNDNIEKLLSKIRGQPKHDAPTFSQEVKKKKIIVQPASESSDSD